MYYLVQYKNDRPIALYGAKKLVDAFVAAGNFLRVGMSIAELNKRMKDSPNDIVDFQSGGKSYGFWFTTKKILKDKLYTEQSVSADTSWVKEHYEGKRASKIAARIAKKILAGSQDVKIVSKLKGISLIGPPSGLTPDKPYTLKVEWGKDGRSMLRALMVIKHFIDTTSDGETITVDKI